MGVIIYSACMLTALLCAFLLFRAYRRSRHRLLMWSGLCFAGLTLNNLFLVLDKLVFPEIDFAIARSITALFAMTVLLFGLIWDSER
jgi:FtsH-binding integral membrane protein